MSSPAAETCSSRMVRADHTGCFSPGTESMTASVLHRSFPCRCFTIRLARDKQVHGRERPESCG